MRLAVQNGRLRGQAGKEGLWFDAHIPEIAASCAIFFDFPAGYLYFREFVEIVMKHLAKFLPGSSIQPSFPGKALFRSREKIEFVKDWSWGVVEQEKAILFRQAVILEDGFEGQEDAGAGMAIYT